MPSYDVLCANCGHEGLIDIKIADLASWDLKPICPECHDEQGAFRRVIKQGSLFSGVAKGTRHITQPRKHGAAGRSIPADVRDDMLHKQSKNEDKNQIAEARDIVRSGKFEGF